MTRWAKKSNNPVTVTNQHSIFDQAKRAMVQGREAAWQHADSHWKRRAGEILQELIIARKFITSEDVIMRLESEGITTGNNRAIGALMSAAKRAGQIKPTGEYKESRLKRRHKAPLRIWQIVRTNPDGRIK